MNIPDVHLPPQNLMAEQSVLGAMMIDRAAVETACDILHPADFYRDAHQHIFAAAKALSLTSPVDLTTLSEELRRRNLLDAVSGTGYLSDLADMVPTSANVEYYANIVRGKSLLRAAMYACDKGAQMCREEPSDPLETVAAVEDLILKISEHRAAGVDPIGDIRDRAMSRIYDGTVGEPFPIEVLNEVTGGGMRRGEYSLVLGQTGMGKTRFLLSIARAYCLDAKPVLFFSLEMSNEQLFRELAAIECGVSLYDFVKGVNLSRDQQDAAADRVASWPLYVEDECEMNVSDLLAISRRQKKRNGIRLVLADFFQLFSAPGAESGYAELKAVAKGFKQAAKKLDLPILVAGQLTAESLATQKRKPEEVPFAHARDSRDAEIFAETVMILHRPNAIKDVEDFIKAKWEGQAIIYYKKNRNGLTTGGQTIIGFREGVGEFCNLGPYGEAPPVAPHYSTILDDPEISYGDPFSE